MWIHVGGPDYELTIIWSERMDKRGTCWFPSLHVSTLSAASCTSQNCLKEQDFGGLLNLAPAKGSVTGQQGQHLTVWQILVSNSLPKDLKIYWSIDAPAVDAHI